MITQEDDVAKSVEPKASRRGLEDLVGHLGVLGDDGFPLVNGAPGDPRAPPAPDWLGTRELPLGPAGYPPARPTPPELTDRRIITVDYLPPPADEGGEPC